MSTEIQGLPIPGHVGSLLEFETLTADTLASLFAAPLDQVDAAVERALQGVRIFFQVDRCGLMRVSPDQQEVHVRLASYAEGIPPISGEIDLAPLHPWSRQKLIVERVPLCLATIDDIPPEASLERESWTRMSVRSALVIPIETDGILSHLISLNAVNRECAWPDVFVTRLRVLGQMLVGALERQDMFSRVREAEERMDLAADSAEAGLWSLDYRTGIFWCTERARAIFGYSPDEEVTVERLIASIHPADRDLIRGMIERAMHQRDRIEVEYRILTSDGNLRWVASSGRTHFTSAGQPDRLMGVSTDVTDRVHAAEALSASEARLSAAADLAGLAFHEIDYAAGTAYADIRLRELCGVPSTSEQGLQAVRFWMDHLHPDDRTRVLEMRERLLDGSAARISTEYRYLHPVHGLKWIHHLACVAARDAAGRTTCTFGVLRDITVQRQAEESLRQSYSQVEELKDRLQAEGEYLKAEIRLTRDHGAAIGQSESMRKVLRLVEQVAPTDCSVLVRGETGTGKELVAQSVHRLSPRGKQLMVKVNCAALPSGLVESELFGREKGAFTGAMTRQVGRFEIADGSTLFLDEIGELSLDVQAKLLRVLESGEFERLGSPNTIKVNVRLIAATNRDLAEAIKHGKFREDLYYRLNVFPIVVPPLRDRAGDIPLLVWSFLEEFSSRMGKKITQVPRKAMEALQRHPWPGNVRELRNVIEHGAILSTGDTLRIPILDEVRPVATLRQVLADIEREHILRALDRTGWRIKGPNGAAAQLEINPGTLHSRMRKLGIQPRRLARNDSD